MAQLIANHTWTTENDGQSSQYTRMIPGVPADASQRSFVQGPSPTERGSDMAAKGKSAASPGKVLPRLLLPHPMADPWNLYRAVFTDLLVLVVAGMMQARLIPGWSLPQFTLPLLAVLVTLFAFSEGAYRESPDRISLETIFALSRAILFATLLIFFAETRSFPLRAIPVTMGLSFASLFLWRQVCQLAQSRNQEKQSKRTLIVGAGPVGRSIARALRNDPSHSAVVRGFIDDDPFFAPDALGRISDLDWLARSEFIDEVILALPGQATKMRHAARVALRNHLDIRAVPDLPLRPGHDAALDHIGEIPIVTLHREPVPTVALSLKRLVDFLGAAIGLLLAAPIMALIALLIRMESHGPVFYSAERTGIKGCRFRCYKFRSMVEKADHLKEDLRSRNQRLGPIFKIIDDPRITRVGRFIRRYSLDELPQLWNVLCGDMSLVGPRPHPVDDVNHYELHHYRRLDVKPGITGLWQITARQSPSFDLNMHLDLTYIENWSLRLDLRILFGTIRVLFAPEGA